MGTTTPDIGMLVAPVAVAQEASMRRDGMPTPKATPMALALVLALALALCAGALAPVHAAQPRYRVIDRIAGPDGGYDYIAVDPEVQRLYVARADGVMAVDLATRFVTPRLAAGERVAAVLPIPGTGQMLSTNRAGNTATLFDRRTGVVQALITVGRGPDAAIIEPVTGSAFVMLGGERAAAVVDPATRRVVRVIDFGGVPEAAVADGIGHVYVNIVEPAAIAVIDVRTLRLVRQWPLAGCVGPTGITFDPLAGVIVSACRNGQARLVDVGTGLTRQSLAIGQGADGALFDAERRVVLIPCNEGVLSVIPLAPDGHAYAPVAVPTAPGARTAALDAATGRLYLPVSDHVRDASGKPEPVAGTFRVLIVAPY
jgi:DNA-binding beta-propeller fold protein YncE